MNQITKNILATLLMLMGIGLVIFTVTLWPRPFNFAMILVGFIPISALGLAFIFVGYKVLRETSIKEALEYLNLFWN